MACVSPLACAAFPGCHRPACDESVESKAARAVLATSADGTILGTDIRGNGCSKCGVGSGRGLCGECFEEEDI